MAEAEGPPEAERQLSRRPSECPFCGWVLTDEFEWQDDLTVVTWMTCARNHCDWTAYCVLEVTPPDAG